MCQSVKSIDPTITEEWPPATYMFRTLPVDFHHLYSLFLIGQLCQQLTLRTCYETIPPELDTVGTSGGVRFVAGTIDCHDRQSVGNSMSSLNRNPGT